MSTETSSGHMVDRKSSGRHTSTRRERGFTFIEITIALLILAGSFVVLLGLQSSAVDREVQDYHRQLAMLVGRRIMAGVEKFQGPLPTGEKTTGVIDMLGYVYEKVPSTDDEVARALDGFDATLVVDEWEVPGFANAPLQRVRLEIAWSTSPLDRLSLLYFAPKEDPNRED